MLHKNIEKTEYEMTVGRELHRTEYKGKNVFLIGGGKNCERFDICNKHFTEVAPLNTSLIGFGLSLIE